MVVPFLEDVGPNEKWQCLHDHIFTCGHLTQIHPEKKSFVYSERNPTILSLECGAQLHL
jgi:hypothetical protein